MTKSKEETEPFVLHMAVPVEKDKDWIICEFIFTPETEGQRTCLKNMEGTFRHIWFTDTEWNALKK